MGRDMSDAFGYAFSMLKSSVIAKENPMAPYDEPVQKPNPYGNSPIPPRPPAILDPQDPEEQRRREMMMNPYGAGSPIGKAIMPSQQEDPNMPVGQRHHRNLERQKDIHTPQPNLRGPMRMGRMIPEPPLPPSIPVPHRPMDVGPLRHNRTLPPNPAQMSINAGLPSKREAGGGTPPAPAPPQPVSGENPFVHDIRPNMPLSDEQIMMLADEFRIPIEKAWRVLKADEYDMVDFNCRRCGERFKTVASHPRPENDCPHCRKAMQSPDFNPF